MEKIFELLHLKAKASKCDAMERLITESESMIEMTYKGSSSRDVCLIFAVQNVEHYEIATYGHLAQLANTSGFGEIREILFKIIKQEKEIYLLLTTISESGSRYKAIAEED